MIDLPLEAIHGTAFRAAVTTRCAGEQGKYWEMRERLFANPLTLGDTAAHVAALGLDSARMTTCMSAGSYEAEIRKDMAQAQAAGVSGTPSFLIAIADPGTNSLKAIRRLEGAQPFAAFKAQLDAVLAEQAR